MDSGLQHQAGTREWYSTSLQATTVSATVQDELCNFASSNTASTSQQNINSSSMALFPAHQCSWATTLLLDCARAIEEKDVARVQSILWILNEGASPYGDSDQRLVSYFVQALLCKISGTGARCHRSLSAAAEKTYSFETMRNMILEFQVRTQTIIGPHILTLFSTRIADFNGIFGVQFNSVARFHKPVPSTV